MRSADPLAGASMGLSEGTGGPALGPPGLSVRLFERVADSSPFLSLGDGEFVLVFSTAGGIGFVSGSRRY